MFMLTVTTLKCDVLVGINVCCCVWQITAVRIFDYPREFVVLFDYSIIRSL